MQHTYTNILQKSLHSKYLTLLQHVSCVQNWLIWLYEVLPWLGSLMIVLCGPKQVVMFSVIL